MAEEGEGLPVHKALKRLFFYLSEMDVPSQQFALCWGRALITLATVVGLVAGYLAQEFNYTIAAVVVSVALAELALVPAWPWFHRRGLAFRPPPPAKA